MDGRLLETFALYKEQKKIIWFQDRLLHRILTTNQFVSKFTNTNPRCSFCKREIETLIHLFCRCEVIARLWSAVGRAAAMSGLSLLLDEKNIILGDYVLDADIPNAKEDMICQIMLLFKFYIYRTKVASGHVGFVSACKYVKFMVAADRPVIDAGGSDKERCVGEAYDWAIEMLDQWIAWGEGERAMGCLRTVACRPLTCLAGIAWGRRLVGTSERDGSGRDVIVPR